MSTTEPGPREQEYKEHPGSRVLHGSRRAVGGPDAWSVWVLGAVFVLYLFSILTGYAVVSPLVQQDAGLTVAQVSLAVAIYNWAFAICQLFGRVLLDSFGARPLLAGAVALVTAGAFLFARTTGLGMLIAAQVVLAIGSSFGFVGAGHIGGRWFRAARYGLLLGLVQVLTFLGAAFGQPALSWQLDRMSWQQLLNGYGAMGILLTVLFLLLVRDPKPDEDRLRPGPARLLPEGPWSPSSSGAGGRGTSGAGRRGSVSSIFRRLLADLVSCSGNSNVMLASAFGGVSFGTVLAIGALWGPRLMATRGADASLATTLTAVSWLGLAIGVPLFILLSDHWHNRRVPAVAGLLLQAAAVALLIYLPSGTNGVSMVTMFCVGLFGGAHVLGFTVAGESVSGALAGTSAAIVNGVGFVAAGLLFILPGKLLPGRPGLADFGSALLIMPILLAAGAVAAFFIRETGEE